MRNNFTGTLLVKNQFDTKGKKYMDENEMLTMEEQRFLIEILRRSITQRKAIYESYRKYIEKNKESETDDSIEIKEQTEKRMQ